MEWNKQTVKSLLLVVCGGVAFYAALQHLGVLVLVVRRVISILSPLLLGGAIAFVLNVPMRAIERNLYPHSKKGGRLRRPLALILTLLAVVGVLTLAVLVILPGVREAAESVAAQVPDALRRLETQLLKLEPYLPHVEAFLEESTIDWTNLSQKALEVVKNWGGRLLVSGGGIVGGVVSGVATFVIGLIFSFYILLQKERLARQGRQVCYALLNDRWAERVLEVLRLANRTFSGFLSGQCLEAVILGTLFVAAMTIFRMPYALLVGMLIAITALIPIVGAFIGCIIGALLIAVTNPMQALLFVVMFLVLQQIEGNLIYPHVVGSSVGLPSIWVLAAVTLGGSLMGVLGMLIFIPLCSVLYALFRGFVLRRLKEKKIPDRKWKDGK